MKLNSVIVNQVNLEYFKWKKNTPLGLWLQVARKKIHQYKNESARNFKFYNNEKMAI